MTRSTAPRKGCWIILLAFLCACAQVPITGRTRLDLVPDETILATSYQQYEQFLEQERILRDTPESRMVQRVGERISKAVEKFMAEEGMADEVRGYEWEFNLAAGQEVNAWAMPGGKVAVYEGLLPVTRDETGLAVVMGHEIAHVIAKHGNERMSQALITQLGGVALATALAQRPETTRQLWMAAFGLGAQVGLLLPYSRLHEREADRLGMIFMAMAGYDPRAAVGVWERMAEQRQAPQALEFLSTHPSDETRLEGIKEFLPEALEYYRPR